MFLRRIFFIFFKEWNKEEEVKFIEEIGIEEKRG